MSTVLALVAFVALATVVKKGVRRVFRGRQHDVVTTGRHAEGKAVRRR